MSSQLLIARRQFLWSQAALAGTALVGTFPLRADDTSPGHTNRDRIYTANKGGGIGKTREEIVETLKKYRELGFDGIEASFPAVKDLEALKSAVREVDIPVHGMVGGVHWELRLSSPDENVRTQGREALEQALRNTREIGGSSVLLVPGKVTGDEETHDDVWKRSIGEIRRALPVASRHGIRILIENVWNGFCEEPDQFRDYIDEIDSPWVGVYFDIGNVRKFGKPEDWIRVLGQRIVKLDVKDWGQTNGFCRLGEGDVDWPAVRLALAEIQYTGWATREGKDNSLEDTSQLMDRLLDR